MHTTSPAPPHTPTRSGEAAVAVERATFRPARWAGFALALAMVRFLPDPLALGLACAFAVGLAARGLTDRRDRLTDWPRWFAAADVLVAVAVLSWDAAPFAAVWLVIQALPTPRAVDASGVGAWAERHLPAVVAVAGAAVVLLAFPAIPGAVVLWPGHTEAGWMLVVYAATVALRPLGTAAIERLHAQDAARPASVVTGLVLLQLGLAIAMGPSPAGVVVAGFVVTAAGVAAVTTKRSPARRGHAAPSRPSSGDRLLGLPPVNVVAGMTAIALAIRLAVDRGIWLDEAISIAQAQLPFTEMLVQLRDGDIHPPLYLAVLWATIKVFGSSELAVRLPSIVAGTLLVPLMYLTGRDLYGKRAGVMAATFATFAPLLVWYSQEARMYSVLLLFAVGAVWFQVRAVRSGHRLDWVGFGACCALMLWTHYFAAIQVGVQFCALVVLAVQRHRQIGGATRRPPEPPHQVPSVASLVRGTGLALAVLLVLLAPLAPFVRGQIAASAQLVGLDVPSRNPGVEDLSIYAIFANAVWALWGYHSTSMMRQLVALWPLAMLFVLFLLGRGRTGVTRLLAAIAVAPVVVLFVAGLRLRDLFEVRYFISAVPALLLLAAYLVTRANASRAATAAVGAVLLASFGLALADQQLSPSNPRRYDFGTPLAYVRNNVAPGDVVVYAPRYLKTVVEYYAPGAPAQPLARGPAPPRALRTFVVSAPTLSDRLEPRERIEGLIAFSARGRTLVDRVRNRHVDVRVYQ